MEFTPIVYIHRHFCTISSYRTHYHQAQDNKPKKYQQQPLSVLPPRDVYLNEIQTRHTLVIRNNSLPIPLSAK